MSSFTSSSSSPSRSSVCSLSKHYGTCLTESIRFYHDPHSNSCRKFRYTGCGGNGNNFLSGEECVRTCGGVLDVSASASAPLTPTVILIFMKIIQLYTSTKFTDKRTDVWSQPSCIYTQIFSPKKLVPPIKNTFQIFFDFCLPLVLCNFSVRTLQYFQRKLN